jgi:hypothetical protein
MTHLSQDALVAWRDHPTEETRTPVMMHLAECAECAAAYAELIRAQPVDVGPSRFNPADFAVRGLAVGLRAHSHSPAAGWRRLSADLATTVVRGLFGFPARTRLVLVGQFALILVLGGLLLVSRRQEPSYTTLSGGEGAAGGARLTVTFLPTATADAVRRTLREVGGSIVSGPSAASVYVVELPLASGNEAGIEAVIQKLRRDAAVISFVERQP